MDNAERWKNDPEYRKQVIQELEKVGTIRRLPKEEFGHLVYAQKV